MSMGARIASRRAELGMSRPVLAKAINERRAIPSDRGGTDARGIARWEGDEVKPSLDAAIHLAAALGVSLSWLLTGEAEAA